MGSAVSVLTKRKKGIANDPKVSLPQKLTLKTLDKTKKVDAMYTLLSYNTYSSLTLKNIKTPLL